tara:strand:- start:1278 stop:1859 length:582 start_codon:yes stop_codon:yes gene_type:complete
MSQTYKVRVKQTLRDTVSVGREWRQKIDLLQLLPADRMGGLLALELEKDGWQRAQDGKVSKEHDQFDLEFDPVTRQLKIVYEQEKEVEMDVDREVNVYDYADDESRANREGHRKVIQEADGELQEEVQLLEKEMLTELESTQDQMLEEIDKMIQEKVEKAQIEALKEKAKSLGDIQSVSENTEAGEITIRVKV